MQNELIQYIESELGSYKHYVVILSELEYEDGIKAQHLSDMPRSVTNKFSSIVENMALWKQDEESLKAKVKRIEGWFSYLNWYEKFVIKSLYFDEYAYWKISELWKKENGRYYSRQFWVNKKSIALDKISNCLER